jgi:hypothetical protein
VHRRIYGGARAFTLIDLLVILAVIGVIAALLVTATIELAQEKPKAIRISCVNNLKQCELAFQAWSGDNNGKLPMEVSTNLGGTRELVPEGLAFRYFQVMSNELSTPKIVACPADTRRAATNFGNDFNNDRVSYFVGANASRTNAQAWLCGDRNITNGLSTEHGILTVQLNRPIGWTENMHKGRGNVSVGGSVRMLSNGDLRDVLKNANGWTNRVILPE